MKIKRLHPDAVIPKKAHASDAGFDLVAVSREFTADGTATYGTGLAFEIPEGHVGLLFPRSSICKKDQSLTNSVGVLDAGYRNEVFFKFRPTLMYDDDPDCTNIPLYHRAYEVGERIGQLIIIPIPSVEFEEAETLGESDRGLGGFGSSGA